MAEEGRPGWTAVLPPADAFTLTSQQLLLLGRERGREPVAAGPFLDANSIPVMVAANTPSH